MGRKSIDWRKDTAILARLPEVEDLHLKGWSNYKIADALGLAEGTVRNDLKRVQSLWHERAGASIAEQKERSVETYRRVQRAAWDEFSAVKDTSLNKSAYLNTIKASEDSIAKVLGIEAPLKVAPTDPTGTKPYASGDSTTLILAARAADRAFVAALQSGLRLGEPAPLGDAQGDAGPPDAGADALSAVGASGGVPR